eukprot:gene236-315_t
MDPIFKFLTLADPNIRYVVLGTLLLTSSAAIVGVFAFLKKKALLGDATAHAAFPGICIAFLIMGTKHPIALAIGAFITGWIALLLIDLFVKHSKIKEDIATSLLLSVTFGIGSLLLSIIQNTANAAQLGLNNYLFGQAAALMGADLWILGMLGLAITLLVIGFFKEFSLIAFDKTFAESIHLKVKFLEIVFTSLIVLAIVIGIRAVGIVLMAAMLITPAAAARFWTEKLSKMILLAAFFGAISGLIGSFASYILPGMPTGPWIVLVITLIAYFSFLFAPHRGLVAKKIRQHKHQRKILHENILKLFYEIGEKEVNFFEGKTIEMLLQYRSIPQSKLKKGLFYLQHNGLVHLKNNTWRLTGTGKNEGERIVRQHRIWELYLTKYLNTNPVHVHENAELIEHLLTPDLVKELNKALDT